MNGYPLASTTNSITLLTWTSIKSSSVVCFIVLHGNSLGIFQTLTIWLSSKCLYKILLEVLEWNKAAVAQIVEWSSTNRKVPGSNPDAATCLSVLEDDTQPLIAPDAARSVNECVWMINATDEQVATWDWVYECVWMG